jgi:hypothetical protein
VHREGFRRGLLFYQLNQEKKKQRKSRGGQRKRAYIARKEQEGDKKMPEGLFLYI